MSLVIKTTWEIELMSELMSELETKLKSIAEIRIGHHFRSKINHNEQGEYRVIQMKNLNRYNEIDLNEGMRINIDKSPTRSLLQPGDILFQSRGLNNSFVLVPDNIGKAVADFSLTIISLKSAKVNPAYLVWYLNSYQVQKQISRFAEGTSLLRVNNSALGKLKIKLPSLQKQDLIAKIDHLSRREQQLIAEIAQKRQTYITRSLELAASN